MRRLRQMRFKREEWSVLKRYVCRLTWRRTPEMPYAPVTKKALRFCRMAHANQTD